MAVCDTMDYKVVIRYHQSLLSFNNHTPISENETATDSCPVAASEEKGGNKNETSAKKRLSLRITWTDLWHQIAEILLLDGRQGVHVDADHKSANDACSNGILSPPWPNLHESYGENCREYRRDEARKARRG